MIVHLSDGAAVVLSVAVWITVCFGIGWLGSRWPLERLARTGPVTSIRRWEQSGRWWERNLSVRKWKDLLPEAGGFFPGGRSKRSLGSRSTENLSRLRAETVRAERVHWLIIASAPVQLIWWRPTVAIGMAVVASCINAPFIITQRVNRGRLDRILERRCRI